LINQVPAGQPPLAIPAGSAATNGSIRAELPRFFQPATAFAVKLAVAPATNVVVYAVEDLPPPQWTVTGISDSGFYDSARGKVKWGPFFDCARRTLTYQVTPPLEPPALVKFSGGAAFDGATAETVGRRQTFLATAPTAPDFKSARLLAATGLELTLTGFSSEVYSIEASTNLIAWQPLVTLTNLSGTLKFVDAGATNLPRRFYRAIWK
jgi:hypothetical protein